MDSFTVYITRMLSHKYPEKQISADAKDTMNFIVNIIIMRLTNFVVYGRPQSVTYLDYNRAVDNLLTGDLLSYSKQIGNEAVCAYNLNHTIPNFFNISRVEDCVKGKTPYKNYEKSAIVFMTAVIEYLVSEIIEASNRVSNKLKKIRITADEIDTAICNDPELKSLLK